MNLIIDVGNTSVKIAVFQVDELLEKVTCSLEEFEINFENLLKKYPRISKSIVSSVGLLSNLQLDTIKKRLHVLVLNAEIPLPFINDYKTPHTLGVDRIALVSAAVKKYPNQNILIIDAGTCVTYDFITNQNQYLGGAISPGIRLRYTSLNNLTANLPLLTKEVPEMIIGNTTNSAIHSGVIYGVLFEIDGVIQTYKEKYSDLTVILTGGDINFLSKQLKSSIFAHSNFLLEGLNHILQYNSNE
ncbi:MULTISPECIES: type III pantothenate kinase [Bizionia]|uniref:Type III pantothenate kinase n=1 Tax=Bizionia algoritergicola TaxID=291187 RepID=A0A5D0R173_9FLAO|nr:MULTISPECIES: type III pantothenate kinase [Bizionia]OBX22454.1 pantothenate kinase [Bizionia sp. APA-3]TYB74646.1 type III pantothenate kinase [Bizionia algoritergicola]